MSETKQTPKCFSCGAELEVSSRVVGRNDNCNSCSADIRCCYNCKFYDESAYNECHETQAERVVDKTRANFCDFFSLSGASGGSKGPSKDEQKKALDDLFK